MQNVYAYVPFLKLHGVSDELIQDMRNFCNSVPSPIGSMQKCYSVYMKQSKVSNYIIENYFLDL